MSKLFLLLGALLAFIGVAAGAFGAHALKQKLHADMLNAFEVGVRYQMYHALALIMTGMLYERYAHPLIMSAGWCFLIGTTIFSGSLYILSLTGIRVWGVVTPIGGVFLLIGWMLFSVGIVFKSS